MKPPLTINLQGPEGNVYRMVARAEDALRNAGQPEQVAQLRQRFNAMTQPIGRRDTTYEDIQKLVEEYCDVTWV
jgi:hypothetical protein